jgi:hypothetical protein
MDDPTQVGNVRFHNVGFSFNSMVLFDQRSQILSVAKSDIRRITLKYGFQSERPIVEAIFGLFVIVLGFYFFVHLILHTIVYRIFYVDDILSLLLLPTGGWFIVNGFRKRLYFDVVLDNDKRKFPLGKNPDKDELKKFIKTAAQLGYSIEAEILNENIINQK